MAKKAKSRISASQSTEPIKSGTALDSLTVEWWPIDRPKPYAKNARKLSPRAIDVLVTSLKEFGWQQPIVVDLQDVIVVGHTRLMAAKKLGMAQVPVHVAANLTPAQAKAYRVMDNRSSQETSFDLDLLSAELLDLKGLNIDLGLTGFEITEIDQMLIKAGITPGLTDEDAIPEVPEVPVTVRGDLWLLGEHRVMCGDSTLAESVSELLEPVKETEQPFLMVTDPPYGVEYSPEWRNEVDRANGTPYGARAIGKVQNDDRCDWAPAYALFPGNVAYIWHAGRFAAEVAVGVHACGFEIRNQLIWAKPRFVIGRGAYHWQHEPCWYAVRKGHSAHWNGDRTQSTLWQVEHMKSETGHGTQKPVELMRRPIVNHTHLGDSVYDPFLGSGTTVMAAESIGRVCYGIEIDPKYVDVIVQRWQEFTGKDAVLDSTGKTFNELRHDRNGVTMRVPDVAVA